MNGVNFPVMAAALHCFTWTALFTLLLQLLRIPPMAEPFFDIRLLRLGSATNILVRGGSLAWRLTVPVVSSRALYMLGLAKVGCDSFRPSPARGNTALPHYAASQGQRHDWT